MQITNKQAAKLIKDYDDNKIFSVKFIKRTDGQVRLMQCRKGVSKFVKGGGQKVDPKHNLVVVFDMETYNDKIRAAAKVEKLGCAGSRTIPPSDAEIAEIGKSCYRSINLEHIMEIHMAGNVYTVNDFPEQNFVFTKGATKHTVKARTLEEARTSLKRQLNVVKLPTFKVTNE